MSGRVPARLTAAPPLQTPAEVADYLQVSTSTLCRWRQRHTGPKFVNVGGMPRYRVSDVDAWLDEQAG
jgi:predicted DNA-binding transcriptional regulator AlpA